MRKKSVVFIFHRSHLFVSLLGAFLLFSVGSARTVAESCRIVDSKGRPLPSVYQGLKPNPLYANHLLQRVKWSSSNPGGPKLLLLTYSDTKDVPCGIVQASSHDGRSRPRLRKAQFDCSGHYMFLQIRPCTQACGGGNYDWYFSDPEESNYLAGYEILGDGCNGCTLEEGSCENGNIH
jgi:hypothetical protein